MQSAGSIGGIPELSPTQFSKVSELVHRIAGINLHEGKFGLVRSRLASVIREAGVNDVETYLDRLRADRSGRAVVLLVDALTTNKTSFFREPRHFELLRQQVLPELQQRGRTLRLWSAGCSSGEEPYTLAMVLLDELGPTPNARILATDISARVLDRERTGVYSEEAVNEIPAPMQQKYFRHLAPASGYSVAEPVRALVRFAQLNLMARWPMKRRFDLICCRNVMIYFDKATQQQLADRFWQLITPGGWFFTGHSESFAGLEHGFRYVEPAVYQRPL